MADIVINHRVGSTRGVGDLYNRYDGLPMPWDEHAVTSDSGGLVHSLPNFVFKWGFFTLVVLYCSFQFLFKISWSPGELNLKENMLMSDPAVLFLFAGKAKHGRDI